MTSNLTEEKYKYYIRVLREELVPAMGCTEPIAIAYAAAMARAALGAFPDSCRISYKKIQSYIQKDKACISGSRNHHW